MVKIVIAPQPGPQHAFLSSPADIVFYGGAAGGGKTYGLLMDPIRHLQTPGFSGLIFRQSYVQIHNEGGLWDESKDLYSLLPSWPRQSGSEWSFAWGSSMRFSYLASDDQLENWQGSQIPYIGWDELTHFSEKMFWYMLSRNRSTCGVRPYIRATMNPDPDSWVASFISWWIDAEGWAIPARSGVVRWFFRYRGLVQWYDSLAAAVLDLPPEYRSEAVSNDVPVASLVKSFTFILSRLKDNKELLRKNPEYLGNMMNLLPVEQARLYGDGERGGNWVVRAAAGKVIDRSWFEVVDAVPAGGIETRCWDFAATKEELKDKRKKQPDATASVRVRMVKGTFYILDVTEDRIDAVESDRKMKNLAIQDRNSASSSGAQYFVRWEVEPASAGTREALRLVRMLAGFDAAGRRPGGDIIQRIKPLASQARAGNVKILRGAWNEKFLKQLHGLPDAAHDDMCSAAAQSVTELVEYQLPRSAASNDRSTGPGYKPR